ncbi:MAG: GGDEF domain-containing phosphodiesterase [Methylotenera sp.]|uniref:GGDEF domain-containing phosphodiesterase n=1 Tax=Methylotenera sp. TaxID=2051956 RepID=UPI00248A36CD|nr:GGDEF domain-containing phosphodiesterase [Methylotenera sp.]MDI1309559.1 GGDEF domain-containing phosphodiesterase [Methylotenera sp.]
MPNLTNITLHDAHQSNTTTLYQDFVIELDSNLLLQLMASYSLKAADVTGDYVFNALVFEQFIKTEPYNSGNSVLKNTTNAISSWPQNLSWSHLNQHINHFLLAWLNDYKLGANIDAAFLLSRCLELKSNKNTQFQSLLIHLIARVTHQLEQYKFSYVQNFDLDTGLPNQRLLINLLNLGLSHSPNLNNNLQSNLSSSDDLVESTHLGLILINLNINFGEVSQQISASSTLMLAVMHTIQRHLNEDATLFHIGATDLAILINPLKSPSQLNIIATKLLHAFETALPLDNVTLILNPHFGAISTFNVHTNGISLYEYARLALNQAIANNEQIKIYDKNISSSFVSSQLLEEAIIEAFQQNELSLFLQPIVCINDKVNNKGIRNSEFCNSAEGLLRWPSQQGQSVSPQRLIDVIYKKGFGKVFIRWLINSACQHCAELASTYQHQISLTLNFSSSDLLDSDLPELLSQSITLWGISASSLTIEITESDILADEVKVLQVLDDIVQLGCKIALDDFGTGYSSMTRLRNLPVSIVKIDQSFVRNISNSTQDQAIVKSIIKLAHSLDKEVIAEGVADLACLNILKEMKCEKMQGYYYGKPMSFNEFVTWLDAFKTL